MNIPAPVLDWLLEEENPSVRWRTLTELVCAPPDDPAVITARRAILDSRPVQKIFAKMHPDGYWLHRGQGAGLGYAMCSSTHFVLSYLAELGLDRSDERISRAVDRYLSLSEPDCPNPAFWQIPPDTHSHQSCLYAYNLRTFLLLGYRDDPRIQERILVLLDDWRSDGGYLCDRPSFSAKTKSCIRGSVKALAAFSLLPETWQTPRCRALVDYFLERGLIYKRRQPGVLIRDEVATTIFPFVIAASLLEPLLALSRMGYAHHPALADAWERLDRKRDEQGRYPVDRAYNCIFKPGENGTPDKWVTFYAYQAQAYRQN
jgi:hypothetical protein